MAVKDSFAVWNNKGGVGKSTVTYHVASRYAEANPKLNVLVIDLCFQSNVSMMLLGGGGRGEQAVLNYCTNQNTSNSCRLLEQRHCGGKWRTVARP